MNLTQAIFADQTDWINFTALYKSGNAFSKEVIK